MFECKLCGNFMITEDYIYLENGPVCQECLTEQFMEEINEN